MVQQERKESEYMNADNEKPNAKNDNVIASDVGRVAPVPPGADYLAAADGAVRRASPLFAEAVCAGFPSPASDYIEGKLDLNEFLVKHPAATFFVRAEGDSMLGAGIHSGDILVVDRALQAAENKVVIAVVDGELTVKRLKKIKGKLRLAPDNDSYRPLDTDEENGFEIWGVVTAVIHAV
ncbi:MAG: LexA family protein [Candidatus Zixiibacteriota bacterium]